MLDIPDIRYISLRERLGCYYSAWPSCKLWWWVTVAWRRWRSWCSIRPWLHGWDLQWSRPGQRQCPADNRQAQPVLLRDRPRAVGWEANWRFTDLPQEWWLDCRRRAWHQAGIHRWLRRCHWPSYREDDGCLRTWCSSVNANRDALMDQRLNDSVDQEPRSWQPNYRGWSPVRGRDAQEQKFSQSSQRILWGQGDETDPKCCWFGRDKQAVQVWNLITWGQIRFISEANDRNEAREWRPTRIADCDVQQNQRSR